MRVRVLQVITSLQQGGAERIVHDLALGLDSQRFEVEVLSLMAGGPFASALEAEGRPPRSLGLRGRFAPGAFFRLISELRRFRPDIIHAHLFHADLAARFASLAAPRTCFLSHHHIADPRKKPWRWRLERMTRSLVDRYIAVSPSVAAHIAALYKIPAQSIEIIENGRDLAPFLAHPTELRKTGPWRLISVGRLDPQKDFLFLLRGLARAVELGLEASLEILGEGPERPRIEAERLRLGLTERVTLLGSRGDVAERLARADAFVLTSAYEGFGLAAVEAMAAGLPVLVTEVAGLRDVVRPCDGWRVPHGDVEALASAIRSSLEDFSERQARVASARERAITRFSLPTMIQRVEALYENQLRIIR